MKAPALQRLRQTYLLLGMVFLVFNGCSKDDPDPVPLTSSKYDIPVGILNDIFISEKLDAEKVLDEIKANGMVLHEKSTPPEIYLPDNAGNSGLSFTMEHNCLYDNKNSKNKGSNYGKYDQSLKITRNPDNSFAAIISYTSVEDPNFPDFPSGLDTGSGTGYVTGEGNNFTIFLKTQNAVFDKIPYRAIWIISGTVSNFPETDEITNIQKCLIMLEKNSDAGDKVANPGTIRIFNDANSIVNQAEVIISDFSPKEGSYATIVTITGSGFSAAKANNIVKFNGVTADVLDGNTTTQLQVVVPKKAGTGPVTVQVKKKATTGNVFTYIPSYTVSTLAGNGIAGLQDGMGTDAQFNSPFGLAVNTKDNVVYVTDMNNSRIRLITPAGAASTLQNCNPSGICRVVSIVSPAGIAINAQGAIIVTDWSSHSIWKISPGIGVSSLAGNGQPGFNDGNGSEAQFNMPSGVAFYSRNNDGITQYFAAVADMANHRIRFMGTDFRPSVISIGTGEPGFQDGSSRIAQFNNPSGIVINEAVTNIYVADTENNRIRIISTDNLGTSTFAGPIFTDDLGNTTSFNKPKGIALDEKNKLIYVADTDNNRILVITLEGKVSILAGTGQAGFQDGPSSLAQFNKPSGIALDAQGNLYVADTDNHRIRKITMILE